MSPLRYNFFYACATKMALPILSKKLTLPMSKARVFLPPATYKQWLTSKLLLGRSARCGCAITHRRAEHIVPYAVHLILLSPTYSGKPWKLTGRPLIIQGPIKL